LAGRAEAADMPMIPIPTAKQAESSRIRMLVPFMATVFAERITHPTRKP